MDATAHYRNLVELGRAEFLASAAPAALVRYRGSRGPLEGGATTLTLDEDASETVEETLPHGKELAVVEETELEIYPLSKKPGASFPDRITIGRTPNNDIVIIDHSVSRFHAYLRSDGQSWVVADAGSKNGSWLGTSPLEARKEKKVTSKNVVRVGDVDLTFFLALDLFAALGGTR